MHRYLNMHLNETYICLQTDRHGDFKIFPQVCLHMVKKRQMHRYPNIPTQIEQDGPVCQNFNIEISVFCDCRVGTTEKNPKQGLLLQKEELTTNS